MMSIAEWKNEIFLTLQDNILRYWIERMTDQENGGYYGRIDGHEKVDFTAEKGAILNARILWAFSAAYRVLRNPEYLIAAKRAKDYIMDFFIDKKYGGIYWSLDAQGNPLDMKKQIYAIGFTIYGMSEFARATGDHEALDVAISLYQVIEDHAFDRMNNGYAEALTRDWQPIADMRLSDKDENGSRTMNTHLHILESYTNLYRIWKDDNLKASICNLLKIFTEKIINPKTYHLDLFFDNDWNGKRNIQSFGHDIEAAWLLHEAAIVLDDKEMLREIERIIPKIAKAAEEGLQPDGSMIYERWTDTGFTDTQRQWWVLCENVIGHLDLYQYFDDRKALAIAHSCWTFIKQNLVDWKQGEWHWSVDDKGVVNYDDDKAGFWKCPYHNSRMCLEIIERF